MLPATDFPLTQAELFRLERFMGSPACGADAMTLSRAHGFLTAAVCGPETVAPGEWIRLIFDEPVFEDAAQAEEVLGLITRLYDHIAHSLPRHGAFVPLFEVVRDAGGGTTFNADEWCRGFLSGMSLAGDAWAESGSPELGGMLSPIFIIASPRTSREQALRAGHYERLVGLLPEAVENIYRYWDDRGGE